MTPEPGLRAACLTPPAAGGIAVIQVVGHDAIRRLAPLLSCKQTIDWDHADAERLNLCQIIDGQQILDDAVVAVRQTSNHAYIVDLNLHGGVRLVQRVLMLLQRMGIQLVEPTGLLSETSPAANAFEQEFLDAIMRAQTRAVTAWLLRMKHELPLQVSSIVQDLEAGRLDAARTWLTSACERSVRVDCLLQGVRVVLTGAPNAGKSTLANCLAERDTAIVHPTPGTTRDWTEHAGTIEGVPVTYVDTAGIRETADPIEQDAIHRAQEQVSQAHIVVHVIDRSSPLCGLCGTGVSPVLHRRHAGATHLMIPHSCLVVWNKSDLPPCPSTAPEPTAPGSTTLSLSAATGAGVDDLRQAILERISLKGWLQWPATPFAPRQTAACRQALALLTARTPQPALAASWLQSVMSVDPQEPGNGLPGYNLGSTAGTGDRADGLNQ